MPPGSVVGADCWAGGNLVFLGVIVSLAEAATEGVAEGWEGITDGATVGAGLHAAIRRMMVMDIPSFLDPLALDHVLVIDQSILGHEYTLQIDGLLLKHRLH